MTLGSQECDIKSVMCKKICSRGCWLLDDLVDNKKVTLIFKKLRVIPKAYHLGNRKRGAIHTNSFPCSKKGAPVLWRASRRSTQSGDITAGSKNSVFQRSHDWTLQHQMRKCVRSSVQIQLQEGWPSESTLLNN
jgi:hypothetical protein